MKRRRPYRLLDHTADIRARVSGSTKKRLLQNAVFALIDLMVEARTVRCRSFRSLRLAASDGLDRLLVRLLQETLFLFDAKGFVTGRLEIITWKNGKFSGRAWGEKFDPQRHHPKTEIKAVTFHQLRIRKRGGYFEADVVFDV